MTMLARTEAETLVERAARPEPMARRVVVELPRRPLRRHPGRGTVVVPTPAHSPVACRVRRRRAGAKALDVLAAISIVEVDPGESLWQLARRVAPDSPSGAVIDRIVELNELPDHVVHAGQPLRVPDGRDLP